MVLSFAIVMFVSGDLEQGITGRAVTQETVESTSIDGGSWLIFMLGIFVGALMLGAYVYVAHIEGKRDE